ncbi:MAG: hypothetical protein CK424_01750 [Legionella sp.]|nr:MAG: hypothetical protein CK424_01750 [Legionella sp.]
MKLPVVFTCVIGCLLFNTELSAHCCWTKDNPGFYDLRVEIKNLGTENCNLEKQDLHKGTLYGSNTPLFLPSTGEVFYLTLSGTEIDVTLTYNCGTNKNISLVMKQYAKKNHKHTSIDAHAINAVNVFEKHTAKPVELGCCSSHDSFGLVTWDLSN